MNLKATLVFVVLIISGTTFAQSPEQNLKKLGIDLPEPSKPVANYVKFVRSGNLIFLAGHGPAVMNDKTTGKVGRDLTIEDGYEAAKSTGIGLLATLNMALDGDLSKVKRIVRVFGMVNCTEDFTDMPKVINGCSDLMVAVFGDNGKHARAAVGMYALPSNIATEIEMIVEVED